MVGRMMMNTDILVILAVVIGVFFVYLLIGGEEAASNVASIPGDIMLGMATAQFDTIRGAGSLLSDGTKAITGGGSITPWGRAADERRKRRKKKEKKREKAAAAKEVEEEEKAERFRLAEEETFKANWWGFTKEELTQIVYILVAVFVLILLVMLVRMTRGGSDQNRR